MQSLWTGHNNEHTLLGRMCSCWKEYQWLNTPFQCIYYLGGLYWGWLAFKIEIKHNKVPQLFSELTPTVWTYYFEGLQYSKAQSQTLTNPHRITAALNRQSQREWDHIHKHTQTELTYCLANPSILSMKWQHTEFSHSAMHCKAMQSHKWACIQLPTKTYLIPPRERMPTHLNFQHVFWHKMTSA